MNKPAHTNRLSSVLIQESTLINRKGQDKQVRVTYHLTPFQWVRSIFYLIRLCHILNKNLYNVFFWWRWFQHKFSQIVWHGAWWNDWISNKNCFMVLSISVASAAQKTHTELDLSYWHVLCPLSCYGDQRFIIVRGMQTWMGAVMVRETIYWGWCTMLKQLCVCGIAVVCSSSVWVQYWDIRQYMDIGPVHRIYTSRLLAVDSFKSIILQYIGPMYVYSFIGRLCWCIHRDKKCAFVYT